MSINPNVPDLKLRERVTKGPPFLSTNLTLVPFSDFDYNILLVNMTIKETEIDLACLHDDQRKNENGSFGITMSYVMCRCCEFFFGGMTPNLFPFDPDLPFIAVIEGLWDPVTRCLYLGGHIFSILSLKGERGGRGLNCLVPITLAAIKLPGIEIKPELHLVIASNLALLKRVTSLKIS